MIRIVTAIRYLMISPGIFSSSQVPTMPPSVNGTAISTSNLFWAKTFLRVSEKIPTSVPIEPPLSVAMAEVKGMPVASSAGIVTILPPPTSAPKLSPISPAANSIGMCHHSKNDGVRLCRNSSIYSIKQCLSAYGNYCGMMSRVKCSSFAMVQDYISNKNYLALYLNTIGIKFASALVLSFVGAFLYLQGVSLPLIFLYFGAEFLLRALVSPLSGVVTTRYGFKRTIILANVLLVAYFISLSFIETQPIIGYMSFIFHSLSRGLYYPTKHYMQAKFVQEHNRGRFLTLEIVIASVVAVFAALLAVYSVTIWDSFWPVALVAVGLLIFSSLSILLLLGPLHHDKQISYGDVVIYGSSGVFRADAIAFTGFAANVVFNNVVVALLVFFVVDSFKLFGIIMASVFILEMIITLSFGRFIDKNRLRSNRAASILQVVSYATFLAALTPLLVTVIKTFYNVSWNIFDSSFTTRFHSKINRQGLLYACSKEVNLGLASGVFCLILAASAHLWDKNVFEVSLAIAAGGVVALWAHFKD